MMPFGLKNARATYQRLVNRIFAGMIDNNMEVYVDDMLVKSVNTEDHIRHLKGMFEVLYKYRMKFKPLKCAFGVASGKFLGYMVNQQGDRGQSQKNSSTHRDAISLIPKEVQSLTGRLEALNRFISKATDRCQPFFQTIKEGKSQFDISYKPRPSIKGQALADFVAEFAHNSEGSLEARPKEVPTWKLYVDRSSRRGRSWSQNLADQPLMAIISTACFTWSSKPLTTLQNTRRSSRA
ncbi:Disease resistance protein TIR-NBS-LRR class family [Abeliophyllum distichum]|uniref:Disease resistance protein TIR-NBS-LRR class family n=1 Tax=Abeliophyllum distichum TaxID=126358 RepID=A0ABD1REX0_9LAMI